MSHAALAELLAPAGDWDCVRAAVANGADAVYFGLPRFNARLRAENFSEADLPEVVDFCHRHGVKAFVAFNTLVFPAEVQAATDYLHLLDGAGVDAVIVQDVGLARLAQQLAPRLAVHASTQMTITSPEGVEFARALGVQRVVLARETSLSELQRFKPGRMPLEVFVHGALCVAYSGQCLTSESLGQRSANRGECAQACRMPYSLVVDGVLRDLGERRYLLSPQDLAAVAEIPALVQLGVASFKIEGRLKSAEYVAAVCQVYRKAIDAALADRAYQPEPQDRYQLEMTFSRGLFPGWMHGVNHQELVPARFAKKRGPFAGRIASVGRDYVEFTAEIALQPGDGIVFDTGGDTDSEQGGRIFEIRNSRYYFARERLDFSRLHAGDRIWKTDDPLLSKRLRQSYQGRLVSRRPVLIDLHVSGQAGSPLALHGSCGEGGASAEVFSGMPLQVARTAPLTAETLREHFGRLGETGYNLRSLENQLVGPVIIPIGELNRLRRKLTAAMDLARRARVASATMQSAGPVLGQQPHGPAAGTLPAIPAHRALVLRVLCRSLEQLGAALSAGVSEVYVDFEDIRKCKDAVRLVREHGTGTSIVLATPRIQKAGEQGLWRVLANAEPDGALIRNPGGIEYFRAAGIRSIGDFSLNVANPLSVEYFISLGLERLTVSYDLNISQVLALLAGAPASRLELTLHQHMPMFHMEHCVFAAFLSAGKSSQDCGRPCERHQVELRDRVGISHPLRADVGCRNTLFNAVAQTGAGYFAELHAAGLRDFRVELLTEDAAATGRIISAYQALLSGTQSGGEAWRSLHARAQLGVTRGTLETRGCEAGGDE